MAFATALLILLLTTPAAYAAQHVVGGNSGWNQLGDYTTWASNEVFTVGDTLLFNYDGTSHGLAEVSQADYNACSSSNAIKTYSDGSTTIPLSKAGSMYFICPTVGHCGGGMKLAINVVAATTTPGTPPTTPTPPSGSSTPSTTVASPPPPSKNGAAANFCNMNNLMLGSLLVLGTTIALMG